MTPCQYLHLGSHPLMYITGNVAVHVISFEVRVAIVLMSAVLHTCSGSYSECNNYTCTCTLVYTYILYSVHTYCTGTCILA